MITLRALNKRTRANPPKYLPANWPFRSPSLILTRSPFAFVRSRSFHPRFGHLPPPLGICCRAVRLVACSILSADFCRNRPDSNRTGTNSFSMASKTVAKDIITLRGSAAIVCEFFGYAANSILYNRGVYPEESFAKVKKYGLPMLLTQDEGVKSFIANLNAQLSEWLEAGKLQRVVLVLMSKATGEVLERWNFSIETDGVVVEKGVSREKSDKEIMREIQAIMRQIASSITYLPCLDETCVFDVLAYTDKDVAVPFTWIESDPKLIANPQMVKLHSFDTKIHKVDTLVSYKNDEWDEQ